MDPQEKPAAKTPEVVPDRKEAPWAKREATEWDRLKNMALQSTLLTEPPKSDTPSAKYLKMHHDVLTQRMRSHKTVVERFEKDQTPEKDPAKARELLQEMAKIEREIDLYESRVRTADMEARTRVKGLKLEPAIWEKIAIIGADTIPSLPDVDQALLDGDGKIAYKEAKEYFDRLSVLFGNIKAMDDGGEALNAVLAKPNFADDLVARVQAYGMDYEGYRARLTKLGSYVLVAKFKDIAPQLKGVDRAMPQIDNILDTELPRIDFNARPDGQQIYSSYWALRTEQFDIRDALTAWKAKIIQSTPEQIKEDLPEIQRLFAWVTGHLKRRTDYGEKIGTKFTPPDSIRDFLKLAAVELSEEFAENLWEFKGSPKMRIAKPVLAVVSVADLAMEKTLRVAQEMCARALGATGLKKIPRVDAMLKTMAKSKLGAELIRSTVEMKSPVTVLLWGLHMQSADNKMLAAYQWAGFLATSHIGDKLLVSAGATLEKAGFSAIAKIPGHPAIKFTATLLVMFGFHKEFNDLTKGLEDTTRYRVLGPDTTARLETVLTTISGDAILNRIVAGMEEYGVEVFGAGSIDPVRDSKQFLQRQQLQGGDYIVDLSRKFTRSFEDWNSVVDREAKNAKNPYLKKLYELEKIDDLTVWSRRQALTLRGNARMTRGWEKQIESIVQKTDMSDKAKNAAKSLNLVSVAVNDSGERNDLAVQKRLFELADLKYAIEDSKDPARKDLQELWKQYLSVVEKMAVDVRLYRHLTTPETPLGPDYHMRIAYQKTEWVGDIDSDTTPKFVEEGLKDELVYQLKRREALEVKSSDDAHLLVQAGRTVQLDSQASLGKAADQSLQKIKDILEDFFRNLSLRKVFQDSGDLAQYVHQQFGALSSAAQSAAYQLDGPARDRIFTLLREELVLPKGELHLEELLARLKKVRKLIHEELMKATGVHLKSVDDPELRQVLRVYPKTKLLSNSTDPYHVEWLGRAFTGEHNREDDITILRINASTRGAWSFEKTVIRTYGLENPASWEVSIRRGSNYYFGRTGSGITYSDSVKMDFVAWSKEYAQLHTAAQPYIQDVVQEYTKVRKSKEYVQQQLATQKEDLAKEYVRTYEDEWKAKKGDMKMYRFQSYPDPKKYGEFINVPVYMGTAKELLEKCTKETEAVEKIIKERFINPDRVKSDWKYVTENMEEPRGWAKDLMEKIRDTKDPERLKVLEAHKVAYLNRDYLMQDMMNLLRLLRKYQDITVQDENDKKQEKPGWRIFERAYTPKQLGEWFDYFEQKEGFRMQFKDLILFACTYERMEAKERQEMMDALEKKYPSFMLQNITLAWRMRSSIVHYPEVLTVDLLKKARDHIDKESGRGSQAALLKEATDYAGALTSWKYEIYEASQRNDHFKQVPGYPGKAKWSVSIKKFTDPASGKDYVLLMRQGELGGVDKGFRYHIFPNEKDLWDFDVRKFGFNKGVCTNEDAWWTHLGAIAGKGHVDIANNLDWRDASKYAEIHRAMTRDVLTSSMDSQDVSRILHLFMSGGDDEKYRKKLEHTLGIVSAKVKYNKVFLSRLLEYLEQNHPINSDSKMRALGRDIYLYTSTRWGIDIKDFDILSQITKAFRDRNGTNVDIGRSMWHD